MFKPIQNISLLTRPLSIIGTDKYQWILVDWQVVYYDDTPNETMVYENYVPENCDANQFLEENYGPFKDGRVISQPRSLFLDSVR